MSPANSPDMRRAHNTRKRGLAKSDSVALDLVRGWPADRRARIKAELQAGIMSAADAELVALIDQVSKEEQEEG